MKSPAYRELVPYMFWMFPLALKLLQLIQNPSAVKTRVIGRQFMWLDPT